MIRQPQELTLFPYTTLFRSHVVDQRDAVGKPEPGHELAVAGTEVADEAHVHVLERRVGERPEKRLRVAPAEERDRKSTRLNSSHPSISYAVVCLKKNSPPVP